MYRQSASAVNRNEKDPPKNYFAALVNGLFLFGYFTLLPTLITVIVHWIVYSLTADTFYKEIWMGPTLIVLSTFLGGTLIRQKIEDEMGGMGLFVLAILALVTFSYMTYQDLLSVGGVYSRFMPAFLSFEIIDYLYLLPAVGIGGMLFYKYFTLKHYS